uniref:Egg secreted protein ESP15-like n=1 Tax=Schistosoma mansoni TaxID=6183 RepID=A0A3Q0KTV3_SCHMA
MIIPVKNCLAIFCLIQLVVFSKCDGWTITCNETYCCENTDNGKLCCDGEYCSASISNHQDLTKHQQNLLMSKKFKII